MKVEAMLAESQVPTARAELDYSGCPASAMGSHETSGSWLDCLDLCELLLASHVPNTDHTILTCDGEFGAVWVPSGAETGVTGGSIRCDLGKRAILTQAVEEDIWCITDCDEGATVGRYRGVVDRSGEVEDVGARQARQSGFQGWS